MTTVVAGRETDMTHELGAPKHAGAPGRAGRIAVIVLSSLTAILVVAAAVVGVSLYRAVTGNGAAPEATVAPSASSAPATTPAEATPTPTPAPTPTATGIALPERCEDIYSATMLQTVTAAYGTVVTAPVDRAPTKDAVLEPLVATLGGLSCAWGGTGDAGGINTTVSAVDAATAAAITDRLVAAGFTCTTVDAGQICRQSEDSADGAYGETHFVGGGLWVATFWSVFGPTGYTEDIVSTLLP